MDCQDYKRWFSPYVDELLRPQERGELEDHLKGCGRCRADLGSLQEMLRALRAMEHPVVPGLLPGIHEKLLREPWWRTAAQRFLAPWPARLPGHVGALAATALLVIVLVGVPWYLKRETEWQKESVEVARLKDDQRTVTTTPSPLAHHLPASSPEPLSARQQLQPVDQFDAFHADVQHAPLLEWGDEIAEGDLALDSRNAAPTREMFGEGHAYDGHDLAGAGVVAEHRAASATAPVKSFDANEVAKGALVFYPILLPLQVQWQVRDVALAASQVSEWVLARQGLVVSTNEHHLSIKLPAPHVPQFLQQFSSKPVDRPDLSQPHWVTISLELILSE
jgi:hypothetical protein